MLNKSYKKKYIHTYILTYIHTYTHTHTHTHTHTVYVHPVNYITLTTVSNVRAQKWEQQAIYQIYVCSTKTVLCQVLTVFLSSSFLS